MKQIDKLAEEFENKQCNCEPCDGPASHAEYWLCLKHEAPAVAYKAGFEKMRELIGQASVTWFLDNLAMSIDPNRWEGFRRMLNAIGNEEVGDGK